MMEEHTTPGEEGVAPPAKRNRVERNPDLALDITEIAAVKELICRNNKESRPRKRLRTMDFFNEAFYTLGRSAVDDAAAASDALALFDEMVAKHGVIPRNSVLAKVFYAWNDGQRKTEALALLDRLLRAKDAVSTSAYQSSFDEKVTTVTLRLVTSLPRCDSEMPQSTGYSVAEQKGLVEAILARAPKDALRRRVFTPLLSFARMEKDWDFVLRILSMAAERGIELWDGDYREALATIAEEEDSDACSQSERMSRAEKILSTMAEHQPVVGGDNAALVHRLLGGAMDCQVSSSGKCSRCGQKLLSFDLDDEHRAGLLRDIEEKLILPRADGLSHYEPEKKVTAEERQERLHQYEDFKQELKTLDYDTVIDGANVGYYGLSSWYATAKREELLEEHGGASGSPIAPEVLTGIPDHPPFPVDVAPKFALIESIRREAIRVGKRPLVILHSRHTRHGTSDNMRLLGEWRASKSFLASPAFLNDDYCWLYAAIVRPNTCIISNDQMRDHHFLMLSPRFFIQWRQRHRITYKAFYSHETRTATPRIQLPRCYSVWVQRAVLGGLRFWHVPYVSTIPVIDQATNRTTKTSAEVDLSKDGDDNCSAWVCTKP